MLFLGVILLVIAIILLIINHFRKQDSQFLKLAIWAIFVVAVCLIAVAVITFYRM